MAERDEESDRFPLRFARFAAPDDGVTQVLPIAIAASALMEINVAYFSCAGVLQTGGVLTTLDALPTLMACSVLERLLPP